MAASRRRPYESPLRAEQMDNTRQKLVQAGVDLVAEGGSEEVTVRRVAAHARVSVPTAYRYFPDRDSLLDAVATFISSKVMGPGMATHSDDLPGWVKLIYAAFEENDKFMRAQLNTAAGRNIRARSQKARNDAILDVARRSFPALSPAAQRRCAAIMRMMVNLPTWIGLHDDWGMNAAEAGELVAWAMSTLVAEVRRHPTALDFDLEPVPTERARKRSGAART